MTSEDLDIWIGCDDKCPARAKYLIKLVDGELAFCGHHYISKKLTLDKVGYEVIDLNKVEAIPILQGAE